MPSDKKPKAKKSKYADPKTGQFRHSDGDRRHRRGASAKEAVKLKKQMRELGSPPDGAPGSESDSPPAA